MVKATVNKWGNALGVRIPKEFCEELNVKANDAVRITLEHGKIVIEPEVGAYTLESRLKNWNGERFHASETDWGAPAGKEIW